MKRKLVQQGNSTLMISLPSKWLKENNLGKGDEVNLEEEEGNINISSNRKMHKKSFTFSTDKDVSNLKNLLTHAYRKGFNRVEIINIGKEDLKNLRQVLDKLLLGFEITSKTKNKVIIENISEPENKKLDDMIERIFSTILETLELMGSDFENGNHKNLEEMNEINTQQDRFILYCRRIIYQENGPLRKIDWELLTFLMHIQHSLYYMYEYYSKNKVKLDKKTLTKFNELIDYFKIYKKAYEENSKEEVKKLNNLKEKNQFGECLTLIEKSSGKLAVFNSFLRESFRMIQIASSPILSKSLD